VEQHLVVGPAGEEDLAGVKLVERAADRPDVERAVVGQAEDCGEELEEGSSGSATSRAWLEATNDTPDALISGAR